LRFGPLSIRTALFSPTAMIPEGPKSNSPGFDGTIRQKQKDVFEEDYFSILFQFAESP